MAADCLLLTGGHYSEVAVRTGLTVYLLYNKCVVADLEPQLQPFCHKTWNCRDFLER